MVRPVLEKSAVAVMKEWLMNEKNFKHPYPDEKERMLLAQQAGIQPRQVMNWFTNARKRLWQPLLKERGEDVTKYLSNGKKLATHGRGRYSGSNKRPKKHVEPQVKLEQQQQQQHIPQVEVMPHKKPSINRYGLRRGQWSKQEHMYALAIIRAFEVGVLVMTEKTTLRSYLAQKLNCDPMRISKKFVGKASIGKHFMTQTSKSLDIQRDSSEIKAVKEQLEQAERVFKASIDNPLEDTSDVARATYPKSTKCLKRKFNDCNNNNGELTTLTIEKPHCSTLSSPTTDSDDKSDLTSSAASTISISEHSEDMKFAQICGDLNFNEMEEDSSFTDLDFMFADDNELSDGDSLQSDLFMDALLTNENEKAPFSSPDAGNYMEDPSLSLWRPEAFKAPILDAEQPIYRHTLVLELDKTLISMKESDIQLSSADIPLMFSVNGKSVRYNVTRRPHLDLFLREMDFWFDVVIFTSLDKQIAEPIMNVLDPRRVIKRRFYAQDCLNLRGTLFKDMRIINGDLSTLILVDSAQATAALQMDNHIGIPSFDGSDMHDRALLDLMKTLIASTTVNDVRLFLDLIKLEVVDGQLVYLSSQNFM